MEEDDVLRSSGGISEANPGRSWRPVEDAGVIFAPPMSWCKSFIEPFAMVEPPNNLFVSAHDFSVERM